MMPYISEWNLECERCHSVVQCDPIVSEYWCKCESQTHYTLPGLSPDESLTEHYIPPYWEYKEYKVAIPDDEPPSEDDNSGDESSRFNDYHGGRL